MANEVRRRFFFALWPDDPVRQSLAGVPCLLPEGAGRRVAAANLHITLVFLGNVSAGQTGCVEHAADTLRGERFTLVFDRLGYWRKPRVIWAGAAHEPPALATLVDELRRAAQGCGVDVEARLFSSHITLARKVPRAPRLPMDFPPVEWRVESFALVESVLRPEGSQYKVIRRWPLV